MTTHADVLLALLKYSPDQERDDHGRFGEGGGLTVGGSGASRAEVQKGIDNIPASHIASLRGVSVSSQPVVTTADGRQVQGLYQGQTRNIQIADKVMGRSIRDPQGTVTHEIGHALDSEHGLSRDRALMHTLNSDATRMRPEEAYLAGHYLSNERETFAESYRLAYSTSGKGAFGLGQKRAEKVFAKSIAAVRARMAAI
jgi:hypothetical protein